MARFPFTEACLDLSSVPLRISIEKFTFSGMSPYMLSIKAVEGAYVIVCSALLLSRRTTVDYRPSSHRFS